MSSLVDVCRFLPTLGGTTDWVYSSAVSGYQSPAAAGAVDGSRYSYRAESQDLVQWEIGYGIYTSSTTTLARTNVLYNSSGTGTGAGQTGAGTKVNFPSAPQVALSALKEDIAPLAGYINGLIIASAGFPYTSINVGAGAAADSTGSDMITLGSTLSKHTENAWTLGTSGGTLDTGTFTAGNFYHVFIIKRPDTGVVDIATSLSGTAPTTGVNIPSAYTLSQWIGSIWAIAGPIFADFTQVNNNFYYKVGIVNAAGTTVGTARVLITTTAPPNKIALIRAYGVNSGAADVGFVIQPVAETDRAPGAYPSLYTEAANKGQAGHFAIPVDASSQIAVRASAASSAIYIETYGWVNP